MSKVMQCGGGGALAYILQNLPTFCHSITYTFILHQKFSSHQQSCLKREEKKSFLNGWCWAAKLFKKHLSARHTTAEDKRTLSIRGEKNSQIGKTFFISRPLGNFLSILVYVHIVWWQRYVTCVLLSSKDSMPILEQKLSDSIYLSFVCPNYWGNRATQQCPVLRHDSTNYHLVIVNNAFDSEVYTKPLRYSLLLLPLSFR